MRLVLVEGVFLLLLSLVAIVEGIRLVRERTAATLQDMLGPGYYVLLVGIAMAIMGVIHLAINLPRNRTTVTQNGGLQTQVLTIFLILASYVFLIGFAGYFVASLLFFLLTFQRLGVKPLPNIVLTLVLASGLYIGVIRLVGMAFPSGLLL